jgi:NADH-quinone oxidoreductase subunit L
MGGLRKYMPWTFWTMACGTVAIAGIPPFAGFWSKDEILWKAYSSAHGSWIFWLIGLTTAFITSFYMFRLLYMTFAGEYRGVSSGDSHGHGDHGQPHESPWVMLGPLVVLAILSAVGGLVGIGNRFEHFLDPVFRAGVTEVTPEAAEATGGAEHILMYTSVAIAFLGWGLAHLLYSRRRDLAEKIAASLGGLYETVANKYYIDEIYAALLVKPLVDGSTAVLWKGVDQGIIDGAVNGAADSARHTSDNVRHMQSGNLRSYAGWIAAGGAGVLAYMIWMGVR